METQRRFTVLDGMILVGSLAVGLAATRWFDPKAEWMEMVRETVTNFTWDIKLIRLIVEELIIVATPLAVAVTLAVLALRLRKPRPRWRRLVRQPGVVACLALALAWMVATIFAFAGVFSSNATSFNANGTLAPVDPLDWLERFAIFGSALGGFAVIVAWATQFLVGRWRGEPTWIDRLGRLIAVGWIVMGLAVMFVLWGTIL